MADPGLQFTGLGRIGKPGRRCDRAGYINVFVRQLPS
jgi:hypothetical protein